MSVFIKKSGGGGKILQVLTAENTTPQTVSNALVKLMPTESINIIAGSKLNILASVSHYCAAGGAWFGTYVSHIYVDGIKVASSEHVGSMTNEQQTAQILLEKTVSGLSAGSHTIEIYGSGISGGTHYISRGGALQPVSLRIFELGA